MAGGGQHDADADNVDTNADDADADAGDRGSEDGNIYVAANVQIQLMYTLAS